MKEVVVEDVIVKQLKVFSKAAVEELVVVIWVLKETSRW